MRFLPEHFRALHNVYIHFTFGDISEVNLPCYRFDFSHCQIWAANLATDGFFFFLNHCPILYESVSFKTKYLSLFLFYGGHVLSNHFWVSYTSVSSQAMSVTGCWGQVQGVGHPGDEKGVGLKSEKARETGWGEQGQDVEITWVSGTLLNTFHGALIQSSQKPCPWGIIIPTCPSTCLAPLTCIRLDGNGQQPRESKAAL